MSQSPRSELAGILFKEIEGYLPEIETGISVLKDSVKDEETLKEVYRLFHNIKGAASQVPYTELSNSAAVCEAVLAGLLDSEEEASASLCNFLHSVNGEIRKFCSLPEKTAKAQGELFQSTLNRFHSLLTKLPTDNAIVLPEYIKEKVKEMGIQLYPGEGQIVSSTELQEVQDECLISLRTIMPLLQELTRCSTGKGSVKIPEAVLASMSKAITTLAHCSLAAGMQSQHRLLSDFIFILSELRDNPKLILEDTAALLEEFLSYVELVFSMPAAKGEAVIIKIQGHFNSLQNILLQQSPSLEDRQPPSLDSAPEDKNGLDNNSVPGEIQLTGEELLEINEQNEFELTDFTQQLDAEASAEMSIPEPTLNFEEAIQLDSVFNDQVMTDDFQSIETQEDNSTINDLFTAEIIEEDNLSPACFTLDQETFTDEAVTEELSEEEVELLAIFQAECEEHLQNISTELILLDDSVTAETSISPELREVLNRIRRGVHTMKGAAAMCGFDDISRCAHSLEDLLDWIHDETESIVPSDISVVSEGIDTLETLSQHPGTAEKALAASVAEAVRAHLELRSLSAQNSEHSPGTCTAEPELSNQQSDDAFTATSDIYTEQQADFLEDIDATDITTHTTINVETGTEEELGQEESLLDEEQQELLAIFQAECEEHLQAIAAPLNSLSESVSASVPLTTQLKETVGDIRRSVHTLKGAAAMVGFEIISTCAHTAEDLLDWIYDEANEIIPEDVSIISDIVDIIESLSNHDSVSDAEKAKSITKELAAYLQNRISTGQIEKLEDQEQRPVPFETKESETPDTKQSTTSGKTLTFQKAPETATEESTSLPTDTGNVRVKLHDLDELVNIEGELVVARGSIEKLLDKFSQSLHEFNTIKDALRRKSQELEVGFEAQSLYGFGSGPLSVPGSASEVDSSLADFDPIELDRYSQLNLIIRSLNEISIDVNAIFSELTALGASLEGQVAKQQLSMGLMQEKLMRIRMTPLSSVSRMLFRTVRQTAKRLGKNVQLTITGEDVFMDRFIWAKTIDPLMHILRNCVDHGIEDKATRTDAGKSTKGRINLDAYQRGRFVVLKISDDGQGVNLDRLRAVLVEDGVIGSTEQLSDEDLLTYLFKPSVSTKGDISQVSGRGVGLDVVLRNIQELRGTVQVHNNPGQGITFELSIPITLSVNRAVIIGLSSNQYAVPIQDISEVKKFKKDELLGEEQTEVMWNSKVIPLIDLAPQLQLNSATREASQPGDILTLIVDTGEKHIAMKIDRVEDQREIVIKDLGSHLRYVRGINGVTLTGEGTIIPILNLRELSTGHKPAAATSSDSPGLTEHMEPMKVLVVDDSISVRFSITRLVEGQEWHAFQAVDGVDALEKLESFIPDVIILDIEMPRMNGYEFMNMIRNNEKYKSIPVVMLTSRASEKHRKKAEELGVNHYMTKPFQDDEFIELLSSMK